MTKISAREAVFQTLLRCEKDNSYSNIEGNSVIKRYSLEGSEKALFTALLRGIIERKITLDYHLSEISERALSEIDLKLLTVLRIGAYQILYFDRIPSFAAVNESVILTKKYIGKGAHSFVNAVLRELIRKKEGNKLTVPEEKSLKLSIEYSMPCPLIEMWQSQYGEQKAVEILSSLSYPHGMTLHTNTLKISRHELVCMLKSAGIDAKESKNCDSAVRLSPGTSYESIEKYAEKGLFFVQDISSQLAVKMLSLKKGETVIDTCSCPGGKSFAMAVEMSNSGKIFSFDIHENKFSLLNKTAEKLGIDIITTEKRDARDTDEKLIGRADAVFCDVPCSGFGIISKKPEIRYRDVNSLERFSALSLEILCAAKDYCKVNGRLLFSTCTLNKRENEDVLNEFLMKNNNFKLICSETFFPSEDRDGFFASLLVKTAR